MANSLKLRRLWATWQKIGLDLSPLYNSDIIGAVALFGGLGVTWRDSVVTAKSPQLACHLPDEACIRPDPPLLAAPNRKASASVMGENMCRVFRDLSPNPD